MKKLIIVTIILALMITLGIAEIVFSTRLYNRLHNSLTDVEISMAEHPKQFDNPETIRLIDKTVDIWKKSRNYVLVVNNHLMMRNLDEKLTMLQIQIEINADQDAPVTLATAMNYIKELEKESHPKFINIF